MKEENSVQYLGINYEMKHAPKLDPTFIPFGVWRAAYLKDAKKPIAIAVERDKGRVSVHHTCIHGTPEMAEADYRYVERYVKFLLWSIGGFKVSICGCSELAKKLQKAYTPEGERHFDYTFVNQLYEQNLEILDLPLESCPAANEVAEPMGGNMDGCRVELWHKLQLLAWIQSLAWELPYAIGVAKKERKKKCYKKKTT